MKTITEIRTAQSGEFAAQDLRGYSAHLANYDHKRRVEAGKVPAPFPISGDATTRQKMGQ